MNFPTDLASILARVAQIAPIAYAKTRNFLDGAVTYLSPYISRGVISTRFVYNSLIERGFEPKGIEKMVQELAWRDYWQEVWRAKGKLIENDLRFTQPDVRHYQIPTQLVKAETGIDALDEDIITLYKTGYIHNHLRMYLASVACNIAKSHWSMPAKWLYYHLLDADHASNSLSWQWVAGANSSKKYFANQENINKYCNSSQRKTFLDVSYEAFDTLPTPNVLKSTEVLVLNTSLPENQNLDIQSDKPTCLYNLYNLDPFWKQEEEANRVLLLEPSHFQKYPVSQKTIDFVLALSQNIPNIQVFVGEYSQFKATYKTRVHYFKSHPFYTHYQGLATPPERIFEQVQGYFPSFFGYWKKCERFL